MVDLGPTEPGDMRILLAHLDSARMRKGVRERLVERVLAWLRDHDHALIEDTAREARDGWTSPTKLARLQRDWDELKASYLDAACEASVAEARAQWEADLQHNIAKAQQARGHTELLLIRGKVAALRDTAAEDGDGVGFQRYVVALLVIDELRSHAGAADYTPEPEWTHVDMTSATAKIQTLADRLTISEEMMTKSPR